MVFVPLYQVLKNVSLDCLCLIAPSVFSNVFFTFLKNNLSCFVLKNNGYFFQVLTKLMALLQDLCYSRNIKHSRCLSPLMLWIRLPLMTKCTRYNIMSYICRWLATCRRFSPGSLVSSTNKTDSNDITETLLKVALITIERNQTNLKIALRA